MQAVAALSCTHVSHRYGERLALDDVTLAVPSGSFAVLMGRNGAGKTTLVSLVTRLYHAQQGSIAIFGMELRENPLKALALMGVVFQQLTIDLNLTVRENLTYHAALHGLSRREAHARIEEELERIGIPTSNLSSRRCANASTNACATFQAACAGASRSRAHFCISRS